MGGGVDDPRFDKLIRKAYSAYVETESEPSWETVSPPASPLHLDTDVPHPTASHQARIAHDRLNSHESLPVQPPTSNKPEKASSHTSTPSSSGGSSIQLIPRSPRQYSITFPDGHSSVTSNDSPGRREPRRSQGERSTASTQPFGSSSRHGQSNRALPQEDSSECESVSSWSLYRVRYKPRSSSRRHPPSQRPLDHSYSPEQALMPLRQYPSQAPPMMPPPPPALLMYGGPSPWHPHLPPASNSCCCEEEERGRVWVRNILAEPHVVHYSQPLLTYGQPHLAYLYR